MKTTTKCAVCGTEFTRYHTEYNTPKHCSRGCANKAPGRMTEEIRANQGKSLRGELNPNWINGSWASADGRVYMWVANDERHLHPTIRPDGYIRRYQYVWNINNPTDLLNTDEIIHHLNHDPTDDRIENLQKTTQAEHARLHTAGLKRSPEAIE